MKSSMLLPIFDLIKNQEKKRKKTKKRKSKIQEDIHEESL
jgi:preprotein translocase subunit YajC